MNSSGAETIRAISSHPLPTSFTVIFVLEILQETREREFLFKLSLGNILQV